MRKLIKSAVAFFNYCFSNENFNWKRSVAFAVNGSQLVVSAGLEVEKLQTKNKLQWKNKI